jgi:hypothetical protein
MQVAGGAVGGAVLGTAMHGVGKAIEATGLPQAVGRVVGNLDLANSLSYKIYSAMPEPLQRKWGAGIVTKWAKRLANGEQLEDVFSNLSNVELATLSKTVIGAERLTPEERAAAEHLTRTEEVGDSSPFEAGPAGDGKHESSLEEQLRSIIDNNRPTEERPSASPVADSGGGASAPEPARPTAATSTADRRPLEPKVRPVAFPVDIYQGLKSRGIPDHLAAGIAAGVHAESRGDIRALGPITAATHGDRALGIGQWLGSRKAELLKRYGPSPSLDQQLDFLVWELKGGDSGGKAVLGARDEVEALHHYITDFMRPGAGAETDKDLARGMTALGRAGEDVGELAGGAPIEVADDPEIARLREEALNLDDAVIGLSAKPDGTMANAYGRRVSVRDINVDADRFQFKAGGDQYGVTDRLQGVEEFDPVASGRVSLWQDRDGKLWVANGHQRTGLARRISDQTGKDIKLDAAIWREADGVSAEDAMAMAALHNMGEDSGTVLDAAKLGRHNVQALENAAKRLPPKSAMVRDARALAKLSDDAFGAVYRGEVAPDHAAVIGHLVPDKPETHGALVDLLTKLEPANRGQAESIIRQAIAAGMHKGEQVDLFGSHEVFKSLMLERAKVLEKVLGELRKSRLLFKTAAKEADTLEAVGSKIAKSASEKEAQSHAQALELVQRLAFTHGPVGEILNDAARQLADGAKLGEVVDAAARAIRELDLGTLAREATRDDSSRLLDDGAGRGGGAGETGEAIREEQPSLTELERATERFSDPDGKATKQQAESSFHDLKATIATDEAFQLDRNSHFLVGIHGILEGAEEGQLGRYHWKVNHDPKGDWISVTIDGETGDGGDDVSHLLTKGLELIKSGKIDPELAGELDRIITAASELGVTRFIDTPAGAWITAHRVEELRSQPGGAKQPPTGAQILAGMRADWHGGYLGNFTGMLRELEAKTGIKVDESNVDQLAREIFDMGHKGISAKASDEWIARHAADSPRPSRRDRIKAASAALEGAKPGELRTVEPFPDEEPGYHRFRYVAQDGTTVGGNYTLDRGPPPFVEGFNVGDTNNPVKLRPTEVRAMFAEIRRQHPEATRVHAFRMTGARAASGGGPREIWIDLVGKSEGGMRPEEVDVHAGEAPDADPAPSAAGEAAAEPVLHAAAGGSRVRRYLDGAGREGSRCRQLCDRGRGEEGRRERWRRRAQSERRRARGRRADDRREPRARKKHVWRYGLFRSASRAVHAPRGRAHPAQFWRHVPA